MSIAKDFRNFIARGNVVDLAVGVVIGSAFTSIVNSMVKDLFMPVIGLFVGRIDFSNFFIPIDGHLYPSLDAAKAANAPSLLIGSFANNIINFLIMAFVVFLVVRAVNKILPKAPPAAKKDCPRCVSSIAAAATKCPNCTADI